MLKKIFTVLLAAVGLQLCGGNFALEKDGSVLFHGKRLFEESVTVLNKVIPLAEAAPEINTQQLPGKGTAINRIGKNPQIMPCRREAFISSDGNAVEISFQGHIESFRMPTEALPTSNNYRMTLDLSDFEGGKYFVITGRSSKTSEKSGVFKLDGSFSPGGSRFLALEKDGRKLAIDFNVDGVTTYSSAGVHLTTRDGKVVASMGTTFRYPGGTFSPKAYFYEGDAALHHWNHARKKYSYSQDFEADFAYSFGAVKTGKQFVHADSRLYPTVGKRAGWEKAPAAETVKLADSGALYSYLKGSGKAVFKVDKLKSGIYFVTLRSGNGAQTSGKFSVKVENEYLLKDFQIPAGEVLTATLPVWIEDGTAEVTLEGNWQLSTLMFQLLQTSFEDRRFRRGFWVSDAYEPSILLKNEHYKKHPAMALDVITEPLAPHRTVVPKNYKLKMTRETLLPPSTEKNNWRFNEIYLSFGANKSKFTDFNTPELKSRAIDAVTRGNSGILLISGMLSRHTFSQHMDRVDDYIAEFTKIAHRRNIKVLDHVDMPLLWNADSGFRVMCETTPQLQRNVYTGAVNRMYCINNPMRNEVFFNWTKNLIRKADIDGIMVDEVTFFTENFCGCRFCRAQFTKDTGLTLSMDETDPNLGNSNSLVWKAWIVWRYKSIGDWWVNYRKATNEVKKDFSMLLYTTHWGFSSRHALPLFEGARAVDILGTEIMSRNVMAAHRPVNAYRKMKSGLGDHYHAPIYGLVYPGSGCWHIAYFGWALNYMSRQTTWDKSQEKPADGVDYMNYAERLDHSNSYPASDVVIVYSQPSVTFPASMRYVNEILGVSEVLTELGIMHDFIIDEALLDPRQMARVKTLVLANARCMSDEQIAVVREFAKKGGTVYMSFHCGSADELGVPRKKWPFEDIFGFQIRTMKAPNVNIASRNTREFKIGGGQWQKISATPFSRTFGNLKKNAVVEVALKDRKNEVPCVVSADYGKGKFIFSNVAWGAKVVEFECGPGKKYSWNPPAVDLAMVQTVLRKLQPAEPVVRFIERPLEVMTSVTGNKQGRTDMLVVNLLNCSKARFKVGQMIPARMTADWGRVDGKVIFEARPPQGKGLEVYAVSPEFTGRKKVAWEQLRNGMVQVTVPGEMIKTFLEIRMSVQIP